MRLLSLTVRNYRIHRDITIGFDPSRNLIGGTNETGKSTLAEAIHRVLFMRHRAGGDLQKSMLSDHGGTPEVELTFESAGETWTIAKQFAGHRGSARLRSGSGLNIQGDEAEEKLATITGNPDGMANRLNELTNRWAHLWVWQGTAGNDASSHAANHRNELVQRLQQQGLAAVMQSQADEQAREKIRIAYEEIFTRTGGVKANSRLDRANKSLAEANAQLSNATEQKQRLESAIIDQENAAKTLQESLATLPAKREELTGVNTSLAKAKELHSRHDREELVLKSAVATRTQLTTADQQIRELHNQAAILRETLVPAEAKLSILADQEKSARESASAAELSHREITASVRLARQHQDLANACLSRFEKSAAHAALTEQSKAAAEIEQSLTADREALSKLPTVTPAQLNGLRKIETQIGQAESALNAIAAGIELISCDQSVLLNGQPLAAGASRVITETTELTLGRGTHLRIQPGGGTSLAQSRRKLDDLRETLTSTLDQLALKTTDEAAEILSKRQVIEQRISNTESRLQSLGAPELPEALATATSALTSATTDLEQRLSALPAEEKPSLPETIQTAQTWQTETRDTLRNAETQEQSLLAAADAQRKTHEQKQQELQAHRESLEAGRKTLESHEISIRLLEQNHGDPTQRATALQAATEVEAAAKAALDATAAALAELNPELLEQQRIRLERVISITHEKQREAETQIAVTRSTLALDGSSDPEADLLQAKARQATANEEQAREQRHADSIALLHRLFSESQSAISASVTQPIADRVAGYLECLFGQGVRVAVDLNDNASITLTRPGTSSFTFDALSGGAKEQVAAAVRLATAEILAANHDGCLPILFDDAFAYSDDNRIQSLQTMLDLAATRGLQVLVLSCTPAAYIGLGAKETRLTSVAAITGRRLPKADSDDSEAAENDFLTTTLPANAEPLFLETLRSLGNSSGNQSLRTTLNWDEATYEQIKNSLISQNLITPGKGRGGSVSIAESNPTS
jgi:DNA repair exonuclease SbcCD ATPase subunit